MDNKKKTTNNLEQEIKKIHKSSKDSLTKEILHHEFDYNIDVNETQEGRDHANEQDHHQKRVTGVKKGFCDQNKCDIYFE